MCGCRYSIGGNPREYGTHSLRRTQPTLIYQRTKSLRAVQLLLGRRKLESTVPYLGIEVLDHFRFQQTPESDRVDSVTGRAQGYWVAAAGQALR